MKLEWIALAIGTIGILGAIVFIAKKRKGGKDTLKSIENKPNQTPASMPLPSKPIVKTSKSAKLAFLENLYLFKALLPTLCDGSFNSSDWTHKIIDINNDELTLYWKKAHTSLDSWLRLLASWGLKPDNCTSFKALNIHLKMYETIDGTEIILGQTYTVIQKCWIQTDSDNKNSIVVLGKVK